MWAAGIRIYEKKNQLQQMAFSLNAINKPIHPIVKMLANISIDGKYLTHLFLCAREKTIGQ